MFTKLTTSWNFDSITKHLLPTCLAICMPHSIELWWLNCSCNYISRFISNDISQSWDVLLPVVCCIYIHLKIASLRGTVNLCWFPTDVNVGTWVLLYASITASALTNNTWGCILFPLNKKWFLALHVTQKGANNSSISALLLNLVIPCSKLKISSCYLTVIIFTQF